MNTKNCFLLILLIFIIVISLIPYYNHCKEYFSNNDLNLNIKFNNNTNKPQVFIPLYSPWRMFYPYSLVYPYQASPFYPFFDQYNIYQRYNSLY
jgi:hypothetical protein